MSQPTVHIESIAGRRIAIKGVGRALYETGYPIGMLARKMTGEGVEVSWLHVADEPQKNGWPTKTILSRLREESRDSAIELDLQAIESFLVAEYEEQRAMIFSYLFGDRETALEWGRGLFKSKAE